MAKPAPKQYLFVSNRDIVVHSKLGHSLGFEKGVPLHVPPAMHAEVMEKGILPVDEAGATLSVDKVPDPAPAPHIALPPEDPVERSQSISAALEAIAKRNDSKDFNAGGQPTSRAVSDALGWKVEPKEISPLWTAYKRGQNPRA